MAAGGGAAPSWSGSSDEVAPGDVDALLVARHQDVRRIPLREVCIRAPPISSSVTFSPITISAIRGEPRYIEAFPSRMITMSQNAGM